MAAPILGDTENRFSGRPNRLPSRRKCFPVAEGGVSSRQSSNVFPVLLALIKTLGWLAAHSPEWLMRLFAHGLGDLMYVLFKKRRYMGTQNFSHAFPDRPLAWHRRMCRESCRRLGETAMLSLAAPFLSEKRIRRIGRLTPGVTEWLAEYQKSPRATVFGTAHFAYWEVQTWLGLLSLPTPMPEFGILFRPLDNPALNAFMLETRSRFGMHLLARREGLGDAMGILRNKGNVGLLFDQNTGQRGALLTLCGRVCSVTELPGLLVEKHHADLRVFYPRRRGFWRVDFCSEPIKHDGTTVGVTIALNRWLERILTDDENMCASWLWTHDRWKIQNNPDLRFRLEAKRDLLAEDCAVRGWSALPRRTRVWVRLPDDPVLAAQAGPLLQAIHEGRRDAELTLVGEGNLAGLAREWPCVHRFVPLPPAGRDRDRFFLDCRFAYIDVFLVLSETPEADREVALSETKQRFGLVRPGQTRPALTHTYEVPAELAASAGDALALWEPMARRFGLQAPVVRR